MKSRQSVAIDVAALVALIAYFLALAGDSVWGRFAADDPGNIAGYYSRGFLGVIADNLLFINGAYRPLGGIYYLALFRAAHLNPFPYHAVAWLLLAANVGLAYWCLRLLVPYRLTARVKNGLFGIAGATSSSWRNP